MSFPRRMPQVSMLLLVLPRAARENWCDKSQGMRSFRMCPFGTSAPFTVRVATLRTSALSTFGESSVVEVALDPLRTSALSTFDESSVVALDSS